MIPRSNKKHDLLNDETPPQDNKMWTMAFLTGLSLSLPLSATLIAARFFDKRFNSPDLSYAFTSFFAAVFLGTKLGVALLERLLAAIRGQQMNTMVPVKWSVSGLALTVLLMVLTCLQSRFEGIVLFLAILTLSVVMAVLTSLTETGALARLSAMPPKMTQAVFLGQGLAGIWTAGVSLMFQVFLPAWLAPHFALVNYSISFFVVITCAFYWHNDTDTIVDEEQSVSDNESHDVISIPQSSTASIVMKIPVQIVTVLLSNILSMTMFPFMVNKTEPSFISNALFHPLAFFISNFADMLGRLVPNLMPKFRRHRHAIFLISLSRFLVLIAFMTGNLHVNGQLVRTSLYKSDLVFFVGLMVSGVVHGAATTMSAMQVPFMVDPEEQGQAAALLGRCGMGGAFLGCLVSLTLAFALKSFAL